MVPAETEVVEKEQYRKTEYERAFIQSSIVEIRDSAFCECKNLREVVFAEGSELAVIGKSTFRGCSNLAKVCLPESLKRVGSCAFYGCKSLRNIRLPGGLEKIGVQCFQQSGLEKLVVPASVREIGSRAFCMCK